MKNKTWDHEWQQLLPQTENIKIIMIMLPRKTGSNHSKSYLLLQFSQVDHNYHAREKMVLFWKSCLTAYSLETIDLEHNRILENLQVVLDLWNIVRQHVHCTHALYYYFYFHHHFLGYFSVEFYFYMNCYINFSIRFIITFIFE